MVFQIYISDNYYDNIYHIILQQYMILRTLYLQFDGWIMDELVNLQFDID